MDLSTVGGRIWSIRDKHGLSRRAFADRLGCPESEIVNVEYNRLKKPEQKESLYRNIATEFGVSLEWIKTGDGDMRGADSRDEISMAFSDLAARHDPVIDGFVQFLRSRTTEQLALIAQQLRDCVECIEQAEENKKRQASSLALSEPNTKVAARSDGQQTDLSGADPDADIPGGFIPGPDIP